MQVAMPEVQVLSFCLLFFLTFASSRTHLPAPPPRSVKSLIAYLKKDGATSFYSISLDDKLYVLDFTGSLLWLQCQQPSHRPTIPCNASACSSANFHRSPSSCPSSSLAVLKKKNPCTCTASPSNPITKACASGKLTLIDLTLGSTEGSYPSTSTTFHKVVASCAPPSLLKGLPLGSAGVAGLADQTSINSLPWQLTSEMRSQKLFAICLPDLAFFGNSYFLSSSINGDLTSELQYTPLLKMIDYSNGDDLGYYVKVKGLAVTAGSSSRRLDYQLGNLGGGGGAMINPNVPYTTFRTGVYRSLLDAYNRSVTEFVHWKVRRVPKVKPFELCFLDDSPIGTGGFEFLLSIDVEMDGGATWRLSNSNLLKRVDDLRGTMCLAFVDGGPKAKHAMVIGGYQMEQTFFLFDLENSRLGFTMNLPENCWDYNFGN